MANNQREETEKLIIILKKEKEVGKDIVCVYLGNKSQLKHTRMSCRQREDPSLKARRRTSIISREQGH